MSVDAVIVAAGASTRFGPKPKVLASLGGLPVLARTLEPFFAAPSIGRIIVVGGDSVRAAIKSGCDAAGRDPGEVTLVPGGARRRDSVEAGLRAAKSRFVAIHDGARPLVTPDVIERTIAAAMKTHGAIAAVPVTDTLKEVANMAITSHPDRARFWAAQTPQVVLRSAWLDAARLSDNDETDDAAMLSRLGLECAVVEGSVENIKITRPVDLQLARLLLRGRRP